MPAKKDKADQAFTEEEMAAMKERAREQKTEARRKTSSKKTDGLADLQEKIAEMPPADRKMAEQVHAIVTTAGPSLSPKTWYGMPAYANAEGKVVCFFQPASKFNARYSTLGFNDSAGLDDGAMWATAYALLEIGEAEEKQIAKLIKKAVK